jgi:hypothetical protein
MARRNSMENFILQLLGIISVTIVAAILATRDYEEEATKLEIIGIIIVFFPWNKLIELI